MSKKRVSLTLDEDLVDRIDSEAERENVNRSQMVEETVRSYFRGRGLDTAVVFCGDNDTRTLQEYEGEPVLSHVLSHLSGQGVSRAILLVGQNRSEIESEFGSTHEGVALEYVSEDEPRGTAAALKKVEGRIDRSFVAVNGHVITDVDLQDMSEVHHDENTVATMALTTVEEPSNYGVARLKGRRILGFEEKPEPGEEPSRLINAGTYIFDPEIFSHLEHDSLERSFERLARDSQLSGYIYGGQWVDISE
ncbi:MAG: sugar phosphate nucleotidyltransferase [Candidatus Nanohaloarchaea archaeon]